MTSPNRVGLSEGCLHLAIKRGDLCRTVLSQALRTELPGCIWEILRVASTADGSAVYYRAVPSSAWQQMKIQPRYKWLLVPDIYRRAQIKRLTKTVESFSVWVLIILSVVGIFSEALRLNDLSWRLSSFAAQRPVATVFSGSLPQRKWVERINELTDLSTQAGMSLQKFGWSGQKLTVDFSGGDIKSQRKLLERLGMHTLKQKGEQWIVQN